MAVPGDEHHSSSLSRKAEQGRFAFGKYEVLRELGRGAMGVVYEARERGLERRVALKLIHSRLLASAEQIERFRLEGVAAAKVKHPGVVAVYEAGSLHGQQYLAMELVEGRTLEDLFKSDQLDPLDLAHKIADVARAVHVLHETGVLHRDLKPSNIIVDPKGHPIVADFGVALLMRSQSAESPPVVAGSLGYIAPEILRSSTDLIGPRVDVYSLGAVLYEGLTQTPPGRGDSASEAILAALYGEPRPPRQVRPEIPKDLEAICLKCLDKAPERRYASAEALAVDLERCVAKEPLEGIRPNGWARLRRWGRLRPALAYRLVALIAFYLITWVNFGFHYFDSRYLAEISAVVLAWAGASFLLEMKGPTTGNFARWIPRAWASIDSIFLTLALLISDGPDSPLVTGYLLMIAISGFGSRVQLVWYTVFLSLVSYGVLVLEAALRRPHLQMTGDRHLIFATSAVVMGVLVAHAVDRLESLSRYRNRS